MKRKLNALLTILLVLIGVTVSMGAGPASTAANHVRKGIQHFSKGEFDAASRAFAEADVVVPENPVIAFDRACALAASGDNEKAKELYLQAALARDTKLASTAHYNLGGLAAASGQQVLGEDPVVAEKEQRGEGIALLLTAVAHYRDCLEVSPDHEDARHNLELIRLFIKNIQAQWEQRDREKARDEMGLLEFLAMIEQQQSELRSGVRLISGESDSPQRRQAGQEVAISQRELQEEIGPLKEKMQQEFAAASQTQQGAGNGNAAAGNDQAQQALTLLSHLADEAGRLMSSASAEIESSEFRAATEQQREVLDRLNQIFMGVAPYTEILQRAIQQQQRLNGTTESQVSVSSKTAGESDTADGSDDSSDDAKEEPTANDVDPSGQAAVTLSENEIDDLSWSQDQVTDWSRMLGLKAEAELPQVESQLDAAKSQQSGQADQQQDPANSPQAGNPGTAPQQPDPVAQLEGLKQSMQKAVELSPQVVQHSTAAADRIVAPDFAGALAEQQITLKLLEEIADPLPKQDQSQDNQQNDDQGDEGEQEQSPDQKSQDQQNQKQDQGQNKEQDQQQREQQEQQSKQDRAMSVLRRAREREKQHRDLQKQLQEVLGGRVPVDRDW